jgi:archaellum component FlaF (FlaF/FlaG flagellin family)
MAQSTQTVLYQSVDVTQISTIINPEAARTVYSPSVINVIVNGQFAPGGGITLPIDSSQVLYSVTYPTVRNALDYLLSGSVVFAGSVTTSGLTMSSARILGRTTAGSGAIEEILIGDGLDLSGGTLTGASFDLTYPANVTDIPAFSAVTYDPISLGWVLADKITTTHVNTVLGISLSAISLGSSGKARMRGFVVNPAWAWPAPCQLWLDVNGTILSHPPDGGVFARQLGIAITGTKIDWNPDSAYLLPPATTTLSFNDPVNSQYIPILGL